MLEGGAIVAVVGASFFSCIFVCFVTAIVATRYKCTVASADDDVEIFSHPRCDMIVIVVDGSDAYPPYCVCCAQESALTNLMHFPCGHTAVCPSCTMQLERCPLCRASLVR